MAVFPMFIDLRDKRCVVVGGGSVATRKIGTLLAFETMVTVVSPEVTGQIQKWKWEGKIAWVRKNYSEEDLEGAFLVIAATSDGEVNEKISSDAVNKGIQVNVADSQQNCSFIFPSVIRRGELIIGVSSSGGYPAFSKHVRERIEAAIPEEYGEMLELLRACRKRIETEIGAAEERRTAIGRILKEVLAYGDGSGREPLYQRIDAILKEYGDEKTD